MLSDDELYNELQGPDAQELLAELNGANERACAVVGAARLDDLLRELLEAYIVEDRDARNQLYGVANPQAMFREFGTKTAVAYAVGLIDDDLCRELRKIGDIRNYFAHRWRSSFDDAPIKKLCSSLSIPKDASVPFPGSQAPSITTTDRKKGILSTLHSNLPTRSTALWPCLPRSDFRSKTDQIEEASL